MKRSSVIIALEICAIAALFVSWSFQRPNSRQVTVGNASEHFTGAGKGRRMVRRRAMSAMGSCKFLGGISADRTCRCRGGQ